MNFSPNPHDCKVEIWKVREDDDSLFSGLKWYTTLQVTFREDDHGELLDVAFQHALEDGTDLVTDPKAGGLATPRVGNEAALRNRFSGMLATCDEPWNANSCPISMLIPRRFGE